MDWQTWQKWTAGGVLLLAALAWLMRRPFVRRTLAGWRRRKLLELFAQGRPALRAAFFQAAAGAGTPRGLRWAAIDWEAEEALARERATGRHVLLAAVCLRFEAIEGGDMEEVEAVGLAKQATAVFHFDGGAWRATGKTIFNLSPAETLRHFASQYERLEADLL